VHISRLTALGEMALALAHELSQPLSAIASYMKAHSKQSRIRDQVPEISTERHRCRPQGSDSDVTKAESKVESVKASSIAFASSSEF